MAVILHVEDDIGPDRYVIDCDVDAHGGLGEAAFGPPGRAKRFADVRQALEFWKRQSAVRPLRPDGKPNRPMSAYSVSLEVVPNDD